MNNRLLVDSLIKNLFFSSHLDLDEFHRKDVATYRSNYDAFVHPMKLTQEEKSINTYFTDIAVTPCDTAVKILPFGAEYLVNVLKVKAPKEVVRYSSNLEQVSNKSTKSKQKTSRPKVVNVTDVQLDSPPVKKQKLKNLVDTPPIEQAKTETQIVKIPGNFYEIIEPFFDEFWNLEFDDDEVTWAFFAKITVLNCKDYKLSDFAEISYCLPVIKEKIKERMYITTEEFVYDFHQMFANIFNYYPPNHKAYLKATELSLTFEDKWPSIKLKLR